jgi:HD-GYP domain-containing protein (c-di-GMP phosphodiesterase class II)
VSRALASERDRDRLLERILLEAKRITRADGGTLYLRTEDDQLRFAILRNDTLDIAFGGSAPAPEAFPSIPLFLPDGRPNVHNVATYAVHAQASVRVDDAYDARGFDFAGAKRMDAETGYRSKSFLTVPLTDSQGFVTGVLQVINAIEPESGEVLSFLEDDQAILEALAAQAGVALENQTLLDGQKALLESVIQMIASAIDSKSPYTGGHCERVPELALGLVKAACDETSGPFSEFQLDEEGWYELRIAAWLHDCGKVVTPVHVMDKATKLETICDRIELVHARFSLRAKELEAEALRRAARGECSLEEAEAEAEALRRALLEDFRSLKQANVGAEFLGDAARAEIESLTRPTVELLEGTSPLVTQDEAKNLSISRGTLTEDERLIINGHMVDTIRMLESLPFPRSLRRVPEYAGGHHERMDGTGYPKGIYAGDMSIPARAMAIADVFEALTAQDRPYKKGKSLSETMKIMGFMKADNHLDPELFDLFVRSGVYRAYAERMLPPELIDEVDEEKLLAIRPKPFELPPKSDRDRRWRDFLEEYRPLSRAR